MKKIELRDVSYVYGERTPYRKVALDHINLSIGDSGITGLMGHTGCGKSTLVQLLNGLLKPSTGKVFLDGVDIWEKPKEISSVRFRVGLVFQYPEYQLFEETVRKDISFGPINMKLSPDEINRRVEQAASFVGIDRALMDKSPFELSGGQKRRVAIAGVIAMEPEVLILDEPAAGLDPMGREDILGGVRSYQRSKNSTVIIVSHSMEDMARYADNLIVMNDGKIHMQGSCHEIFAKSEELIQVGLGIPQITRLFRRLKETGAVPDGDIFTVEDAVKEICRLAGNQKIGGGKTGC